METKLSQVRCQQTCRACWWQGSPLVQHLYGRARHVQPRAQVLGQHRDRHLSGDAQVGLLQDPLPCARVLALHENAPVRWQQTLHIRSQSWGEVIGEWGWICIPMQGQGALLQNLAALLCQRWTTSALVLWACMDCFRCTQYFALLLNVGRVLLRLANQGLVQDRALGQVKGDMWPSRPA